MTVFRKNILNNVNIYKDISRCAECGMYPEFIAQAKAVNNLDAVRTLTFAGSAEAGHAKYYNEAKNNLAQWKEGNVAFYVCPQCGLTTDELDFAKCPQCGEPKEDFKKVV